MSIECYQCKKTFSTWQSHKRHVVNEHSVINMSCLRCTKCGKLCKSLDSVKMHEKRHESKSVHVCDVCGKGYNTAKSLKVSFTFYIYLKCYLYLKYSKQVDHPPNRVETVAYRNKWHTTCYQNHRSEFITANITNIFK